MMQQYSVAASVSSVSFSRGPVVPPAAENASNPAPSAANGSGVDGAANAEVAESAVNGEIGAASHGAGAEAISDGVPRAEDCVAKGGLVFAETENNNLI